MRNTGFLTAVAALCGALAVSSTASAGTITSAFRATSTGALPAVQQDNDFSFEYQATDLNGNGILDIGDSIWGVASFESIGRQGGTAAQRLSTGQGSQVTEFTAIFATQIVDKTFTGTNSQGVDQFAFVMGPDADFNTAFGNTAGTMVSFFDDPGKDFDPNAPLAGAGNIFEVASNGTRVLDIGFTGALPTIAAPSNALGETWIAEGADDPTLLPPNAGPFAGDYFGSINALFQGGGYENFVISFSQLSSAPGGLFVQFSINGQIFASPNTTLTIGDSADVFWTIEQVVPEPSTFAIWGIGAVGVAVIGRRRRKA